VLSIISHYGWSRESCAAIQARFLEISNAERHCEAHAEAAHKAALQPSQGRLGPTLTKGLATLAKIKKLTKKGLFQKRLFVKKKTSKTN